MQRWYLLWRPGRLSWKTNPLAGQVNPGPQTPSTLSKPHYTDLRCFDAPPKSNSPNLPLLPPSFSNSFQMRIEFLFFFFMVFMLSFVNLNQKWAMRHRRETHTQFNDVFTDNSNCQILASDDIVQSADAHNCLSLSLCATRSLLVKQADLISGKNLLGGKEAVGASSEARGFYQKKNNSVCWR